MTYFVSLKITALVIGLLYLAGHLPGALAPARAARRLRHLPRNYPLGVALMLAATAWFVALTGLMDLGELSNIRAQLMIVWGVAGVLTAIFVPGFLALRALGCLLLLAAALILDAAFLVQTPARYVMTIMAYAWAIKGMGAGLQSAHRERLDRIRHGHAAAVPAPLLARCRFRSRAARARPFRLSLTPPKKTEEGFFSAFILSGMKQSREVHPAPAPETADLKVLRRAAARCTACPLYKNATQTVFGEGRPRARLVLVGEQPGDQEDRAGHPFVGPSGRLLDRALAEAGIDRKQAYITNAVKHFKWEASGKRRVGKKPSAGEIAACRPWLKAEMAAVAPEVIVCLGGTAAQSVLGPQARVLRDRGKWFESEFCSRTTLTVHPSSLLRAPADREKNYRLFVRDLRRAAKALEGSAP